MKQRRLYFFLIIALIFISAKASAADTWPLELANECSSPASGWIWCDDFEQDRRSEYFGADLDRQTSVGVNGSVAAAFHFKQNLQAAGGLQVAFGRTPSSYFKAVDDGTEDYREIYWRMFVFMPTSWVGNGADKLSRATILAGSDWSQAMIAHVWSGPDPGSLSSFLLIDPASGTDVSGNLITTGYNDFDNLRWLGYKPGSFSIFAPENFGKWHCVEAHVKLNDQGQENGIFRLFINNNLEVESTTLNWVGSYNSYGINAVFFENYWNSGSPVDQTRYFDNLVISTEPIGCGTTISAPMPPSDVTVR